MISALRKHNGLSPFQVSRLKTRTQWSHYKGKKHDQINKSLNRFGGRVCNVPYSLLSSVPVGPPKTRRRWFFSNFAVEIVDCLKILVLRYQRTRTANATLLLLTFFCLHNFLVIFGTTIRYKYAQDTVKMVAVQQEMTSNCFASKKKSRLVFGVGLLIFVVSLGSFYLGWKFSA